MVCNIKTLFEKLNRIDIPRFLKKTGEWEGGVEGGREGGRERERERESSLQIIQTVKEIQQLIENSQAPLKVLFIKLSTSTNRLSKWNCIY